MADGVTFSPDEGRVRRRGVACVIIGVVPLAVVVVLRTVFSTADLAAPGIAALIWMLLLIWAGVRSMTQAASGRPNLTFDAEKIAYVDAKARAYPWDQIERAAVRVRTQGTVTSSTLCVWPKPGSAMAQPGYAGGPRPLRQFDGAIPVCALGFLRATDEEIDRVGRRYGAARWRGIQRS
jgi:hypothetical protein